MIVVFVFLNRKFDSVVTEIISLVRSVENGSISELFNPFLGTYGTVATVINPLIYTKVWTFQEQRKKVITFEILIEGSYMVGL